MNPKCITVCQGTWLSCSNCWFLLGFILVVYGPHFHGVLDLYGPGHAAGTMDSSWISECYSTGRYTSQKTMDSSSSNDHVVKIVLAGLPQTLAHNPSKDQSLPQKLFWRCYNDWSILGQKSLKWQKISMLGEFDTSFIRDFLQHDLRVVTFSITL